MNHISLLKIARNDKLLNIAKNLSLFDRNALIESVNKNFLTDQWLNLERFPTEEIIDIYIRLIHESNNREVTPYNGYIIDGASKTTNSFYGSNFPRLSVAHIEALKYCYENKDANFLDLGSGWGSITWKALLAGCKVYAADISFDNNIFKNGFNKNIQSMVPNNLYGNNLKTISSSALNLLKIHPEYKGMFDIVHSSKVLHCRVPKYFGDFSETISKLLKPSGKAVITADSVNAFLKFSESNCIDAYNTHKSTGSIAPGYILIDKLERSNTEKLYEACYTYHDPNILLSLEEMPPHKYEPYSTHEQHDYEVEIMFGKDLIVHSYILPTFEIEGLNKIFNISNFEILDSYYYGESSLALNSMLDTQHPEGIVGIAIIVQKIGECDALDNICYEQ